MLRLIALCLLSCLAIASARAQEDVETRAAAMPAGEPGKTDVFVIALAGDGQQWVFGREARRAITRLDEHFGTLSRSLLLSNQPKPDLRTPIASRITAEAAIQAVAKRMNPDEDVLLLFFTSHGWKDGSIALSNGIDNLPPITAPLLDGWLKAAGVRRSIIILSACYAGSWAKDLASDNRIILMAARADRSSFGCSDDRELTFFGEAFLEEGLGKGLPLLAAFDRAKAVVAGWEKDAKLLPSEPVASIGIRMKPLLAQIERNGNAMAARETSAPAAMPRYCRSATC